MYARCDDTNIMIGIDTDKITEELFEWLMQSYLVSENSMKGINFVLDGVKGLFCKGHNMSINRCAS